VVLRLDKALTISGRVFDRQKRPVADARVVASPAPGVPDLPGHASATASDGEGRFVVDGLLPGGVMLTAGTDTHYPTTVGPVAPEDGREVEIVLLPALRATFEIKTDDGGAVENASVRWQTTGTPPRQALQILPLLGRAEGDAPSEVVRSEVVKVPCEGPTASFEVKADGYAPWKSDPVELPPDGGETTIALTLRRDTGQASLRVMLEDERGTKVHFVNAHAFPTVMRLDGVHVTSGFVIEPGEDVRFTSLPPGPYRIGIHAHDFAPREVDVTVSPGEQAETKVVLEPAAKVRVRFVAPEAVIVRFRVTQGGRVVLAMPEGSVQGTDAATQEPIYAAGASGLLLGGMAPGTYAIEVTNDDLGPSTTTVRLREGETEEVEIPVRGR
jgi:hypothetical protein